MDFQEGIEETVLAPGSFRPAVTKYSKRVEGNL
jgi:hypothetical protein